MFKNTRFGELLKELPRRTFNKLVAEQAADKYCKGFTSYDHLVAMMFSQLSGAQGLRDLETRFNSQSSHHYHLGTREIKRSTLSDANSRRSADVFAGVCRQLMQGVHKSLKDDVQDLLYLLDSSGIRLSGKGFDDWTETTPRHRVHGLKMHVVYAPQELVPIKIELSSGRIQDVEKKDIVIPEAGATYAFDKGYYDYNWWYELNQKGALFVTRFKKNATIDTLESNEIPENLKETIQEDSTVQFKKLHGKRRKNAYIGTPLRKVVVKRPDNKPPLILATNDFERTAEEIAEIYKKRWAIELFFKWVKQNLKIKQYLGRSENAVKIQIYTALIAYLLIKLMHKNQNSKQSLRLFMAELCTTLFSRSDIDHKRERRHRKREQELERRQVSLAL